MPGDSLPVGAKLADYEVEGVLGEPGGFGITYRARDIRLERQVAIKEYFPSAFAKRVAKGGVKPRDKASEQIFDWGLERFIEEARTLAQFGHPSIVRVLHLIEALNGTAYIVMELVTGRTLEAMVEEDGVLDEARFRPMFEQLLAGCEAIHGIGIIHRDIKPSNIIVRPNGEAVLIDFGAARDLALERRKGFTAAIVADGYSPPEQYSMKAQQDARSDIYALAATAYFVHTGDGPTPASARAGGDEMEPAAKAASGRGRPAYLKALDHALELKTDNRPASVATWRKELAFPTEAPAKATLDRRGVLAIAGGATILAGVGGMLVFSRPAGPGGKAAVDGRSRALKTEWVVDLAPVVSTPFASVAALPGGMAIAGQRVGAGEETEMIAVRLDDRGGNARTWSLGEVGSAAKAIWPMPDGGVLVGGDVGGGQRARIVRLNPDWSMAWSRDLGEGSVSCLVEGPSGVGVGIEGADGSGYGSLIFIDEGGNPAATIPLIDQKTDSVQKALVRPDGGILVLGRRLLGGDRAGSQLWVARLTPDGQGVWRKQVGGLGITAGWALAAVGDDIFVAGTTRPSAESNPRRLLSRLTVDGTEVWTKIDKTAAIGSGRALALAPGRGKPALYIGGSEADATQKGGAYLAQVDGQGGRPWTSPARPAIPGETLGTIESLTFRADGRGFASSYVQGEGGLRRLVAIGLSA